MVGGGGVTQSSLKDRPSPTAIMAVWSRSFWVPVEVSSMGVPAWGNDGIPGTNHVLTVPFATVQFRGSGDPGLGVVCPMLAPLPTHDMAARCCQHQGMGA